MVTLYNFVFLSSSSLSLNCEFLCILFLFRKCNSKNSIWAGNCFTFAKYCRLLYFSLRLKISYKCMKIHKISIFFLYFFFSLTKQCFEYSWQKYEITILRGRKSEKEGRSSTPGSNGRVKTNNVIFLTCNNITNTTIFVLFDREYDVYPRSVHWYFHENTKHRFISCEEEAHAIINN